MSNVTAIIEGPPAKRRGGRPTIRKPEILRVILEAAATGAPAKACCAAAGISYEAFRAWCVDDPGIEEEFLEARERARVRALRVLQEAAPKDWRASAEWLRLAHRDDYSPKADICVESFRPAKEIVVDNLLLERLQAAYQTKLLPLLSVQGEQPVYPIKQLSCDKQGQLGAGN